MPPFILDRIILDTTMPCSVSRVRLAIANVQKAMLKNNNAGHIITGITPLEAENIAAYTAWHVLQQLKKFCQQENTDFHTTNFQRKCSIAACTAYYLMKDAGLNTHLFQTKDAMPELPYNKGHFTALVRIPVVNAGLLSEIVFSIDHTFRQFCDVENISLQPFDVPGFHLYSSSELGAKTTIKLLQSGYTEFTPETAQLYLDCFNGNSPCFSTPDEYSEALKKPADIRYSKEKLIGLGFDLNYPQVIIAKFLEQVAQSYAASAGSHIR